MLKGIHYLSFRFGVDSEEDMAVISCFRSYVKKKESKKVPIKPKDTGDSNSTHEWKNQ